jgi:hypothetical protein
MTEGVPIESKLISRRIENAQKAVEAQNFEARKHLLEYDDVMNKQRETIYSIRRSALEGKEQKDYALGIAEDIARELVETYCPQKEHPEKWNVTQFAAEVLNQFGIDVKAAGIDPAKFSPRRAGGHPGRARQGALRREGKTIRRENDALARAAHHSGHRRHAVERPPAHTRPLEGRHRSARLRAKRSARRIQKGSLHAL